MAIPTYSKEIRERAKKENLRLVKLELTHPGGSGGMAMSTIVGPEMAKRIEALWCDLCNAKIRGK